MSIYPDNLIDPKKLTEERQKNLTLIFSEPLIQKIAWAKLRDLLENLDATTVDKHRDRLHIRASCGPEKRPRLAVLYCQPRQKFAHLDDIRAIRSFLEIVAIERETSPNW